MIRGINHWIYINAVVETRSVIILVLVEGADMPTGKTKSRCAWEAVNAPAILCLYVMCRGCGNGNRNLRIGGATK